MPPLPEARDDACAAWPSCCSLLALVAGCGTPGGDSSDNAEKAEKAEKSSRKIDVSKAGDVTLTVWDQEVRGGQRRQIEQLNDAFQARYPNVTIKRVAKSFTDLNTTLKLAVSGDKAPDVVQANQGRPVMGALVKGGLLRPLDAYADAYGWADRYPPVLLDLNRFSHRRRARSAPASCSGSRRWARSSASSTTATRCRGRRRRSATSSGSLAGAKADGEVPISFGNLDKWPGHPRVPDRAERLRAAEPGARLRVRARGRVVRHAGEPSRRRASSQSGRRRATSRRTSTASATTRRGSSSPRARGRS